VALIGLSGAGKTTVAPLAAARLGFPWLDLDQEIERAAGKPIATIFAEKSEAEFRALEAAALEDALATKGPGLVLACGGGVVTTPATRSRLRSRAFVVWLRVSPAEALTRIGREGVAERPLLRASGGQALEAMLRERAPLYEGAADAVVDTDGLTPGDVADRVTALCRPDPTWP
jgi:shikimate kinase